MSKRKVTRVLMCGSRSWDDADAVRFVVRALPHRSTVIVGDAAGADLWAQSIARLHGHHVAVVAPLWDCYGKSAGHIRNAAMLDLEPDFVVAFHRDNSPGTAGCIKEAERRGIKVQVVEP